MTWHHAFVIEAEAEEGIAVAQAWAEKELGMKAKGNPDVIVMRYGLLSVAEARLAADSAASTPFSGETKVVIISANRVYHEAQNAFLKLFEEPPKGTYIFLIMPTLGGLLPTLRSRIQVLAAQAGLTKPHITIAKEFIKASREERSAMIKRLDRVKDEEGRRDSRNEALAIINGIEAAAYKRLKSDSVATLLSDIAILRDYLYDRSAPVRMILEHLSLVTPKDLV